MRGEEERERGGERRRRRKGEREAVKEGERRLIDICRLLLICLVLATDTLSSHRMTGATPSTTSRIT